MTKTATANYHARIRRVLDHIDRHLDDNLNLDVLSGIAAFSKYHFHRQFSALLGLSVHRYIQLARLKRASYRLAFRNDASVTQIALDAGYDSPEAFARAFRQRVGQLPSVFKNAPDWEPWLAAFQPLENARTKLMQKTYSRQDVKIVDFPATPIAIMEHRGHSATLGATIRRFIAWRRAGGLRPATSATYNLFHSDPRTTPPADYRLDLCVATNQPITDEDQGVQAGLIPGGRCAVLRVIGRSDDLEPAALYLYRHWLPESGEELRDFPLYCERVSFFPEVPEHEAVTDLFLPLR